MCYFCTPGMRLCILSIYTKMLGWLRLMSAENTAQQRSQLAGAICLALVRANRHHRAVACRIVGQHVSATVGRAGVRDQAAGTQHNRAGRSRAEGKQNRHMSRALHSQRSSLSRALLSRPPVSASSTVRPLRAARSCAGTISQWCGYAMKIIGAQRTASRQRHTNGED